MPFLNPERKPTIHHPQGHRVAVIAAFNILGDMIPRYFCVEDDYSERFKYQISSVKHVKNQYMVINFYCTYDAYGHRNDIILNYDVSKCIWAIG